MTRFLSGMGLMKLSLLALKSSSNTSNMSQVFRRMALQADIGIQNTLSSKNRVLWNHPAGPKTIHFWCPMMKVSTI